MKSLSVWGVTLAVLAGCLPASTLSVGSTGASRASGASPDGMITVPNLFGMTKEQAMAELRRAGFQGSVSDVAACAAASSRGA